MPAQVVVVKRPQRRAFAVLRSAPAWLRALMQTLRAGLRRPATLDLASIDGFQDPILLAPERRSGILTPELGAAAKLDGCATCGRCVDICPSRALEIESTRNGESDFGSIRSFGLDTGRCIGCGDCVRICPSNLLVMNAEVDRVGAGAMPTVRSLIADSSQSVGS